jgi:uncharacterized membrane protein (UPF0127 family)
VGDHEDVRRIVAAVALVAMAATSGCHHSSRAFGRGMLSIRTPTQTLMLRVEIADTEAERQTGLMNRTALAPDAGMAFVFDRPADVGFWMKDTLIPLDIAYWTRGGRIVAIRQMRPCRADPCPLYSPGSPYVGAVEANLGFFADHGVRPGATVHLVRS